MTSFPFQVPFDMVFSDDFLSGKKPISEAVKTDEGSGDGDESDTGSEPSAAPTELYQSPFDTPRDLAVVDLTLGAKPTKYDLKESYRRCKED